MAFIIEDDFSETKKQHLNLSVLAHDTILSDMFTFGEDKLSGFINTVLENYCPTADASVSLRLNQLSGETEKLLSGFRGDERTIKRIKEKLIEQRKGQLISKAESYESGVTVRFWINQKNLEYLTEPNSECEEDKFYKRRGKYIKSVLEEYARLPYIEREKVYFYSLVKEIEYAVCEEKQLKAVTGAGTVYSVYPYKILSDPLSIANYLVGYCKQHDRPQDEKQPCSFRISALKSVKAERSKSAFLKNSDKRKLSQMIASRGVQFMVGSEEEIRIRLTEVGISKYYRQAHLRPNVLRKEDDVFIFRCTTAQAEFYFFKFGKDAEILQPIELRDKFKRMFEEGASLYRKPNTII